MIVRVITLAGGLVGAAGFSQFPEFSQQYAQRLGGAVDELHRVVQEFDSDAAGLGLDRAAALTQLSKGGDMGAARALTMGMTIARHDRLAADLDVLQGAGPFTRAYRMQRFRDRELAARAWAAYKPAIPFTFEGAIFAGAGFVGGIMALALYNDFARL